MQSSRGLSPRNLDSTLQLWTQHEPPPEKIRKKLKRKPKSKPKIENKPKEGPNSGWKLEFEVFAFGQVVVLRVGLNPRGG